MIKTLQKLGTGKQLAIIKSIYDRPTANIIHNCENASSKMKNKSSMSTLTLFIQHSFGSLSPSKLVLEDLHGNQRRKRTKAVQAGKEKLPLFSNDMIPYIENPKDATRKLLGLTNEFGNIARIQMGPN